MLIFCPVCANILTISRLPPVLASTLPASRRPDTTQPIDQPNRFECPTCPYHFVLKHRFYEETRFKRKQVEDVLGGEDAWKNVDKDTNVQCPNQACDSNEAFWYQLQIRSADEPMTRFYRCCKCHKQWQE